MFLFPSPQFYYFTSSFLNCLLLHNVNLSQPLPHSWIPSASIFVIFPSRSFLFSSFSTIFTIFPPQSWFPASSTFLLFFPRLLHLLIYSIYFSIHKYIDLISTLDSNVFNTASWIVSLFTKLCWKKVESRVDVGSVWGRYICGWKIYRINKVVVEEEGK